MAGARSLWRATGMTDDDFGKPIIAIANSFTQFVPGHVHLKDLGQLVAGEVMAAGGVAKEFNTIAVDDGIAMGHDGMLYSLPSRELIADAVEYMVNAHCADALVCISNCDKITPGMLMAAMRLNIPTVFVSGGAMEAGKAVIKGTRQSLDLIDAMVIAADDAYSDEEVAAVERAACPTCGSCSGMFTANSMNCLTEALGLALPGNGTVLATHVEREGLFRQSGRLIVELAKRWYEQDDARALPRNIANRAAFANAMSLDIAMGGSTNTVLHLLAAAREGGVAFNMADIDRLSRQVPWLCKVAPACSDVHIENVHRAGGIMAILGELDRAGLIDTSLPTIHAPTLKDALDRWDIARSPDQQVQTFFRAAPGNALTQRAFSQSARWDDLDTDRSTGAIRCAESGFRQGRRPRGAVWQPGAGGLYRQNSQRRPLHVGVRRQSRGFRKSGGGGGWHPWRPGGAWRCGGHPLRRPQGRPWHAGNALPHQLSQIQSAGQVLRAFDRRAIFGRQLGPVHRTCLTGSGGRWTDRPGGNRGRDQDRYSQPFR